MVMTPGDSAIQPLLKILKNKSAKDEDRIDAYITLSKHLSPKSESDGDVTQSIVGEVADSSDEVFSVLVRDISGENDDVTQAALQALGLCAHYLQICSALSDSETKLVIKSLCDTIYKTSDKNTCTRAMWCVAKQNFTRKILEEELHALLSAIEHGQCKKNFQSATVEYEALNAIIRLLEQLPLKMMSHADKWGRLVYPLLLHHAPRVRERALMAMDIGTSAMLHQRDTMARDLLPDLKAMLISEMEKLMKAKHEIHVLKVWCFYVQILGKMLHSGSLINQMLPIVEMGFKNSNPTIKVAAYKAWSSLIDNFSGNPDIISDHKRVKLLMQVFRINNTKTENVGMEKLKVWWHLVCQLGDKASLYFEQVCVPLMHYSFHGTANPNLQTPGKPGALGRTPNSKLVANPFSSPATPGSSGNPPPVFTSVQALGCQILAMMLGKTDQVPDGPKAKFTLDSLEHDLIPGLAFFTKHASVFIKSVKDCITHVGPDVPEPLLLHIWYALVAHVKNVLDYAQKKDSVDIFTAFLTCFQDTVEGQCLPPDRLLKLFQAVMCLPPKVLASSAYSIGVSVMYGCPALSLLDLLFNHRILENTTTRERLYVILEQLVACGFHTKTASLGFCQSTVAALDRVASSIQDRESLWRMWSIIANPLMEHVIKTNEVNQGNTLEHDFSCLYSLLEFPVHHILCGEVPQTTTKSLLITWSELYRTFARLSAMVANAEENVCCEELCHNIVDHLHNNQGKLKDVQFLETLLQMSLAVIEAVDFSSLTPSSNFNLGAAVLSPTKFPKKKRGVLNCLGSFVHLTEQCLTAIRDMDSGDGMFKADHKVLTTLYTHITSSPMICEVTVRLAPVTAYLYQASVSKATSKLTSPQITTKLEKLWVDMVMCFQARFSGPYDSDFLSHVSPLLEATFLHPKRQIKNQTSSLWNTTFARGAPLQYPESLKRVLTKVKEKTPIQLPGWEQTDVTVIDDSPYSQASMGGDSQQVPLPNVPGMYSPHKPRGSFMNKVASPELKKSPLKTAKSPGLPQAKRKLNPDLTDMSSQDFVVIKASPHKKRVLTEHQREVLKEKHAIPALYSNVDASMDVSLMAQFTSDTQMSEGITDTPTETPAFDVTPFPFSKEYTENDAKQEEVTPKEDAEKSTKKEKQSAVKGKREEQPKDGKEIMETKKGREKKPKSRRSVRFSSEEISSTSVNEDITVFESKLKELKRSLNNSQEVVEIEKSLDEEKATVTKVTSRADDSDDEHDGVPMETDQSVAMETGGHEDTVESSVPSQDSLRGPGRGQTGVDDMLGPHTFQSSSSQTMSECSKEVAAICGSVSRSTRSNSPKKPAKHSQETVDHSQESTEQSQQPAKTSQNSQENMEDSTTISQHSDKHNQHSDKPGQDSDKPSQDSDKLDGPVKRGRGRPRTRPQGRKSPGRAATPSKKPVDERQSIDKFFTKSPIKPSPQAFFSMEPADKSESKSSGPAPVVYAEETQPFSPKGASPEKKTGHSRKGVVVEETPAKDESSGTTADKDQASKNLFGERSPDIIPSTQDSIDDQLQGSQPFSVTMVTTSPVPDVTRSPDVRATRSPTKAQRLDEGLVENHGLTTPTKSKMVDSSPSGPASPMVRLIRLSQEEIAHYSPQRITTRAGERSGSVSSEQGDSGSEGVSNKASRVRRRGSIIPGITRLAFKDAVVKDEADDLITDMDKESNIPVDSEVRLPESIIQDEKEESMEVEIDLTTENTVDPTSVSQAVNDTGVSTNEGTENEMESSEGSQATIITRHRRRKPPTWLKDMHTPNSEKKRSGRKAENSQPGSQSSQDTGSEENKPKKRGRKKKLNLDNSAEWSQQVDSQSQDQAATGKEAFVLEVGPTLAEDLDTELSQSQVEASQSLVSGASSNQEQATTSSSDPVSSQESKTAESSVEIVESKAPKKRGRKPKPKMSTNSPLNLSSLPVEILSAPSRESPQTDHKKKTETSSSGSQSEKKIKPSRMSKKTFKSDSLEGADKSDSLEGTDKPDPLEGTNKPDPLEGADKLDSLEGADKLDSLEGADKLDSLEGADKSESLGSTDQSDSVEGAVNSLSEPSQSEKEETSDNQDGNTELTSSELTRDDSMDEIPMSELGQKVKASVPIEPLAISSAQSVGAFSMSELGSSDKSENNNSAEPSNDASDIVKDSVLNESDNESETVNKEQIEMNVASEAKTEEENMETNCDKNVNEPSSNGDVKNISEQDEHSCADIFSSGATSTPSEPIAVPGCDDQNNNSGEKRKKRARKKHVSVVDKQLNTDTKSPLLKRLRSQKPHLRTRALNRSLDSLQIKKKKSPKRASHMLHRSSRETSPMLHRSPTKETSPTLHDSPKEASPTVNNIQLQTKDDMEVTETRTEQTEVEEKEEEQKQDVDLEQGKPETIPSPTESDESLEQTSSVMDSLNAAKEPKESPVKASPPKKGKPFDIPETPTSATKHTMSRASLILQRARMMFAKPSKSPPSLRQRAMARGSQSETKILPHRPGILKSPSSRSPKGEKSGGSPTACFRPIQMPRIYSPSASPSAGILRKRRLSGEVAADSPSPPMKQRRVCFNEKVQTVEIPKTAENPRQLSPRSVGRSSPKPVNRCLNMPPQPAHPPSPLVTTTSGKGTAKMSSAQNKFITSHTPLETMASPSKTDSQSFVSGAVLHRRKDSQCTQSTMDTPSDATQLSTQESQLDRVHPICPELADCETSIDQILPQLTTSVWLRGLDQLVRSKKIMTIGKLSSMTEQEVHSLPIKSPKIPTVRKALRLYIQQNTKGTAKEGSTEPKDQQDFKVPESPTQDKTLPPVEDELKKLSPIKMIDLSMDADSNQEILQDINPLDDGPEAESPAPCTPKGSLAQIRELSEKMTSDMLKDLASHQLVELHQHLNTIMSNVVGALRSKCPSPTNTQ